MKRRQGEKPTQRRSHRLLSLLCLLSIPLMPICLPGIAAAYTANKVWVSRLMNGTFRVSIEYTIPALKERRLAYTDFGSEKEAQEFYWDVVRGADFFIDRPKARRFENPPPRPQPW